MQTLSVAPLSMSGNASVTRASGWVVGDDFVGGKTPAVQQRKRRLKSLFFSSSCRRC